MSIATTPWQVETRTKASGRLPWRLPSFLPSQPEHRFWSRAASLQDMFFILTMLVLAQNWNLLAGYAGLVSVGQQAFVGFGAYAMFAAASSFSASIRIAAIFIAGWASALLAIPTAFFTFRLQGAYFAIGTWVIAEVVRLLSGAMESSRRRHRHLAASGGDARRCAASAAMRQALRHEGSRSRRSITYWLALLLALATIGFIYGLLRSQAGTWARRRAR